MSFSPAGGLHWFAESRVSEQKSCSYCGDAPSFSVPTQKFVILVSRVSTNFYAHTQQVLIFSQSLVYWLCFSGAMAAIPVGSTNTHFIRLASNLPPHSLCVWNSLSICKSGFVSIFPNKLLFTSRSMNMYLRLQQTDFCLSSCRGFHHPDTHPATQNIEKVANLIHFIVEGIGAYHRLGSNVRGFTRRHCLWLGCVCYLHNRVFLRVCHGARLQNRGPGE